MRIHLGGHLSYYHPQKQSNFEDRLETPVELNRLLERLGIPSAEIGLFILNGEVIDLQDTLISDPDILQLYPPSQGG